VQPTEILKIANGPDNTVCVIRGYRRHMIVRVAGCSVVIVIDPEAVRFVL
jgi:hypothetical protein